MENARSLIDYWEHDYDWRRFESELNHVPQFLTEIDGLDIHFIHVKSENPAPCHCCSHADGPARSSSS
ncbi:epoxide hydrolase N-terminal domain-containing protein [Amycolatopsis sp. NPDC004378]